MSKPSRRPNRENRPKKKRDRELKRHIDEMPVVVTFYDEDGNEHKFFFDCEACWAQLRADDHTAVPALPDCRPCRAVTPSRVYAHRNVDAEESPAWRGALAG